MHVYTLCVAACAVVYANAFNLMLAVKTVPPPLAEKVMPPYRASARRATPVVAPQKSLTETLAVNVVKAAPLATPVVNALDADTIYVQEDMTIPATRSATKPLPPPSIHTFNGEMFLGLTAVVGTLR